MAKPKNRSLSRRLDWVESTWSVFLVGVEAKEAGPLGWWLSKSAKEEAERKVKLPPWKKMMMGREEVSVGTKRRNQRLREGSTMMSEDLTPFTGLGFGLALT
nr:hypothetical protein CFP56_14640 [Quercus suber]